MGDKRREEDVSKSYVGFFLRYIYDENEYVCWADNSIFYTEWRQQTAASLYHDRGKAESQQLFMLMFFARSHMISSLRFLTKNIHQTPNSDDDDTDGDERHIRVVFYHENLSWENCEIFAHIHCARELRAEKVFCFLWNINERLVDSELIPESDVEYFYSCSIERSRCDVKWILRIKRIKEKNKKRWANDVSFPGGPTIQISSDK